MLRIEQEITRLARTAWGQGKRNEIQIGDLDPTAHCSTRWLISPSVSAHARRPRRTGSHPGGNPFFVGGAWGPGRGAVSPGTRGAGQRAAAGRHCLLQAPLHRSQWPAGGPLSGRRGGLGRVARSWAENGRSDQQTGEFTEACSSVAALQHISALWSRAIPRPSRNRVRTPAPCLRFAGLAPGENLHIQGFSNDIESARAAGCPVFCVPTAITKAGRWTAPIAMR